MEGCKWVDDALDFLIVEPRLFQARTVLLESLCFLVQSLRRFLSTQLRCGSWRTSEFQFDDATRSAIAA